MIKTTLTFALVSLPRILANPSQLVHGHKAIHSVRDHKFLGQTVHRHQPVVTEAALHHGHPAALFTETAHRKNRVAANASTLLDSSLNQQTDADTIPPLQSAEEFDKDFPDDSSVVFAIHNNSLGGNETAALSDFQAEEEVEEERAEVLRDLENLTSAENSTSTGNSTWDEEDSTSTANLSLGKELQTTNLLDESVAKRALLRAQMDVNKTSARRDRLMSEYERIRARADKARLKAQNHASELQEFEEKEELLKEISDATAAEAKTAFEKYKNLTSKIVEAKRVGPELLIRMEIANRTESAARTEIELATLAARDADTLLLKAQQRYDAARGALGNIHEEGHGDAPEKDYCIQAAPLAAHLVVAFGLVLVH